VRFSFSIIIRYSRRINIIPVKFTIYLEKMILFLNEYYYSIPVIIVYELLYFSGGTMREIRAKLMTINREHHDPEILQLLDLIAWKLEEYENRIINLDRVMRDILTDRRPSM